MSVEITTHTNILNELTKAVKMHNFYPEGHPNLDSALGRCFSLIKKEAEAKEGFSWKIDYKGVYLNKTMLAVGNPEAALLAKKFYLRKIKELAFTPMVSLSDMKFLLSVVRSEPEDIAARGGIEVMCAEKDITGILMNEMHFNDIKKLRKELEDRKEKEKVITTEKSTDAPAGQSEKAKEEEEEEKEEQKDDETFKSILARLKDEKDSIKYKDLSLRLGEKGELLLSDKKFDEIFNALAVLSRHAHPPHPKEINELAIERIKAFLTRDNVIYLIDRLKDKNEPGRYMIEDLLTHSRDETADMLITELVSAPEAIVRRHLFNAVLKFGKRTLPFVEAKLSSREWYVVRQMVALLGELGDSQSIESLISVYGHPDVRVKKEVLKSLVRVQSPRSIELLVKALDEVDQSLKSQAIISLGALKDSTAIEAIGKIAVKWDAFSDNIDPSKEAIKALGLIRDDRALPYLTQVLNRKVWLKKKSNEELKALAAGALAAIGTPQAYEEIERACGSSEGELLLTCKKLLEKRERV